MIAGVGDVHRMTFVDLWHDLAGLGRVRAIRRRDLVAKYVTKYVTKGGEIDVGGPWREDPIKPQVELL